jgi:hypothetical protein
MSGTFKRGVSKIVTIAEETNFGVLAGGTGRQLRRVNFAMNLNKDGYESQEILPSQQLRDGRHGVRRVTASMNGQLSPGTYTEFWENMLRRRFTAGVSATGMTVTAVAGPPGTFTRAAGNWITDGFKVGDVVRFTGFTAGAAVNNARNYRVSDLTATIMTVSGVAPEAVVAAASAPSIACAVVGRKTFVPTTGHLFLSHSIDEWMPDGVTPTSNRGLGMTMQAARINVPPTGFATVDFQMVGQNMTTAATQAYGSATAPNALNSLVAVNGRIRYQGADVAFITGAQIQIAAPVDGPPVVGSDVVPSLFAGVIRANGSINALLRDNQMYDVFQNETEVDLHLWMTTDNTANADFFSIVMNRVKLMSNQRNDSDRAIIQSFSFSALEHVIGAGAGTKFEGTTITLQDSAA